MKVYIVMEYGYEDREVKGVYDSQEKADSKIEELKAGYVKFFGLDHYNKYAVNKWDIEIFEVE